MTPSDRGATVWASRSWICGLLSHVSAGVAATALIAGLMLSLARTAHAIEPIDPVVEYPCAGCLTASDRGNNCDNPGTYPAGCPTCTCNTPKAGGGKCT